MIDSTAQLCFGGVSSRDICSVSLGGVALFCSDPQGYPEVTCKGLSPGMQSHNSNQVGQGFLPLPGCCSYKSLTTELTLFSKSRKREMWDLRDTAGAC